MKRGHVARPCTRCGVSVRFLVWEGKTGGMGQNIYHWVNDDGAHHTCEQGKKPFAKRESSADTYPPEQLEHMRDILDGVNLELRLLGEKP